MAQLVTLGGDRLGSGNKQKVALHNYEMTSFNLSQDFISSMSPGVLYPFLRAVATNHGTFDVDLDTFIRTKPTVGPLFSSFKLQADLFAVPFRLYQGILHNNNTKVGMNMSKIYLPKILVKTAEGTNAPRVAGSNDYNYQVSDSALIKYNGISGIGSSADAAHSEYVQRKFQCIPELAYYDIFKNYYANKQEEKAYVITPDDITAIPAEFISGNLNGREISSDSRGVVATSFMGDLSSSLNVSLLMSESLSKVSSSAILSAITFEVETFDIDGEALQESSFTLAQWDSNWEQDGTGHLVIAGNVLKIIGSSSMEEMLGLSNTDVASYTLRFYVDSELGPLYYNSTIALKPFSLVNIDDMRDALLCANKLNKEFVIADSVIADWNTSSGTDSTGLPYSALVQTSADGISWNAFTQNGLVVKTYQSDLFNNWLDTEYIDGENGISAISSVAVVNDKFSMDSLNLAEKIYDYLNRVLVSGATYEDWQEATYGQGAVRKAETPMYVGGMSCEIMFEEVVATTENEDADQVLGSLGGRGRQTKPKGGHHIHVKCDEPSYLIGIISITPRVCYSQGNDWDRTELDTMDDLHKPALDGIGFQNLMVEQMAWWNTIITPNSGTIVHRSSAGKQVAWQNYMTAIDKCFGDFANQSQNAFMVLNRNYERGSLVGEVRDVTTYIDPSKFNYAFAQTDLSAQNFWVEVYSHVVARRKMSGKQIPNL